MSVRKYRKRPVVIEAIRWTGDNLEDVLAFTGKSPSFDTWFKSFGEYKNHVEKDHYRFKVFTLEGTMVATLGDYIIKGVDGEFYPCKPDIFSRTYEVVIE